jgi:hypothetical protein
VLLEDFPGDRFVLSEDDAACFVAEAGHHLDVPDEVGRGYRINTHGVTPYLT